jgi:hypothetical protein
MSEVRRSDGLAECWLALAQAVSDSKLLVALRLLPKGSPRTVASSLTQVGKTTP